jgi:hypothetical protein
MRLDPFLEKRCKQPEDGEKGYWLFVMEAELEKSDFKRLDKWLAKQRSKDPGIGFLGDRFSFRFVPMTVGTALTVKDEALGEEIEFDPIGW